MKIVQMRCFPLFSLIEVNKSIYYAVTKGVSLAIMQAIKVDVDVNSCMSTKRRTTIREGFKGVLGGVARGRLCPECCLLWTYNPV